MVNPVDPSASQIVTAVPQPITMQHLKIPVNLSSTNWENWSIFVETGLSSLRKGKYLTDEPIDTEDWKADDSSIRMILWNAMEPDILSTVHTFKTTKSMWDHLKSTYSKKTSLAHAYTVTQAYARCEQGDATLTEYFTKFKKLSDEMRDLFPFPSGTEAATQWDKLNTITFMGGMSTKYASARPILLAQTTTPSLSATYHLLREMFPSDRNTVTLTNNTVMVADSYKKKRPDSGQSSTKGGGSASSSWGKDVQCHYCKEWGHMKWDCPKRKGPPRQPRAQVAAADPTPGNQNKSEENVSLVQRLERLEQLSISRGNMTSQPQSPRATIAHSGMVSNCFITSKSSWIVDSGATDHMTGNRNILSELTDTSLPPVQIANGSTCDIKGTGLTQISPNMPLSSVLYVPTFPENLMSVSKITEQLYCSVTFTPTKCIFQELGTNRLIGTAYKDKGLYHMESSPQRVAYLSTSSAKEVHSQLGHPSLQVLKKIRCHTPNQDFWING